MNREHVPARAALGEALALAEALPERPAQLGLDITMPLQSTRLTIDPDEVKTADLLGLPGTAARRQLTVIENNAGKGRPRGIRNHKTEAWIDYLTKRYASPLEVLSQIANAPIDELARELHCSRLDALREKRHAAEALAPFLHQRLAILELRPPGDPRGGIASRLVLQAQEDAVDTEEGTYRIQEASPLPADASSSEPEALADPVQSRLAGLKAEGLKASTLLLKPQNGGIAVQDEHARNESGDDDQVVAQALDALSELVRDDPRRGAKIRARLATITASAPRDDK